MSIGAQLRHDCSQWKSCFFFLMLLLSRMELMALSTSCDLSVCGRTALIHSLQQCGLDTHFVGQLTLHSIISVRFSFLVLSEKCFRSYFLLSSNVVRYHSISNVSKMYGRLQKFPAKGAVIFMCGRPSLMLSRMMWQSIIMILCLPPSIFLLLLFKLIF